MKNFILCQATLNNNYLSYNADSFRITNTQSLNSHLKVSLQFVRQVSPNSLFLFGMLARGCFYTVCDAHWGGGICTCVQALCHSQNWILSYWPLSTLFISQSLLVNLGLINSGQFSQLVLGINLYLPNVTVIPAWLLCG